MTLGPLFELDEDLALRLEAGADLLTPNRRLSRAVRDALAQWRRARRDTAWVRGDIMPHRQYWLDLWNRRVTRGQLVPRRVMSAPMQRLLWQQIIEADPRGFSLLNTSRAAALCQEAHERLELWCLDPEDSALAQSFSFGADSEAFLVWSGRFRREMRERAWITPEQAVAELAQVTPDAREILLLHLDDLPPLYQRIAKVFDASVVENGSSPRANTNSNTNTSANTSANTVRVFSDPREELSAAAQWCKARHDQHPTGRYAVVLSDMDGDRAIFETLLRRCFDCLTVDYDSLPVNFATGFRLDQVPLIRDALHVLSLNAETVSVDSLVTVLHSRFLADFEQGKQPLQSSVDALKDLGQAELPQFLMRGMLNDAFRPGTAPWDRARALEAEERLLQSKRVPSQWIATLQNLLEAWGWPRGQSLDSLEYQQLQHWQQALESFAALDEVLPPLDYGSCLAQLRSHIGEQQFQPQTQDRGIQVLGPLETTGLSFDGLWVTGMDAQQWPAAASPNPYLPTTLQRKHEMPHCDSNWEHRWSHARWSSWCASTGQLLVSYVNRADEALVSPSPLLLNAGYDFAEEAAIAPTWFMQNTPAQIEDVSLHPVPLSEEERSQGTGSAVIEDQSLCPFRAFARGRLNAFAPSDRLAGLFPWERGQLLHRALHFLYGVFPDHAALEDADEALIGQTIEQALDDALKEVTGARRVLLGSEVLDIERLRMAKVLTDWLSLEMQRTPFSVVAREETQDLELAGLTLRLRIDRKDQLADGRTLIIDYKTGKPEVLKRWFEARPKRPQLLLYALLDAPADGIAYGCLRPGEAGYSGVGDGEFAEGIHPAHNYSHEGDTREMSMALHREYWRSELEQLVGEYVAGENRVDPQGDACDFCQRQALCRVNELAS